MAWVCLFTCVVLRAMHLEIVEDLSAEEFLQALRRFIVRRGTPKEITLDNVSQFKLAKSVAVLHAKRSIHGRIGSIHDPNIQSYIAQQRIKMELHYSIIIMGGRILRVTGEKQQNCFTKVSRKEASHFVTTIDNPSRN